MYLWSLWWSAAFLQRRPLLSDCLVLWHHCTPGPSHVLTIKDMSSRILILQDMSCHSPLTTGHPLSQTIHVLSQAAPAVPPSTVSRQLPSVPPVYTVLNSCTVLYCLHGACALLPLPAQRRTTSGGGARMGSLLYCFILLYTV